MAAVQDVTDAEFEKEVLQADLPVLVDFWAEWCGPCHVIEPILADLAGEYSRRLKFVKIDTEENFDAMERYGVRGLPTLLIFKDGQKSQEISGTQSKDKLRKFVERVVALG